MATLKEISYNIKNILEGGRSTQSSQFSLRQIAFFAIYYRALLIRRDTNYFKNLDGIVQDLGVLSVENAPEDFADIKVSKEIPDPIRMRSMSPITFVGSPDLREQYPFSERGNARFSEFGRYTGEDARSFMHDSQIYITTDESISEVRIKGIFDDPRDAWSLRYQEPYDWEINMPGMPEDLIQRITQSLLKGEGQAIVSQILDTESDNLPTNQQPNTAQEAQQRRE